MPWDAGPTAVHHRHAWLPLNEDLTAINVAAEQADNASILNLYRALIALRRRTPALAVGAYGVIESRDNLRLTSGCTATSG